MLFHSTAEGPILGHTGGLEGRTDADSERVGAVIVRSRLVNAGSKMDAEAVRISTRCAGTDLLDGRCRPEKSSLERGRRVLDTGRSRTTVISLGRIQQTGGCWAGRFLGGRD